MEKTIIKRQTGEQVEAFAPVIVSASRSTDVPAFYAKWFMNRLKAGYVVWYNPFNRHPSYVSFERTKAIVFWTKNPAPLLPYLSQLDEMGIDYYFQFTLNDYENEGFEPKVPKLNRRVETFKKLSEIVGSERIIWRFDPIILTEQLRPHDILLRIWHVGNQLKGYTSKLVFSFVDVKSYRKVQQNLIRDNECFNKDNVLKAEPNEKEIEEICIGLTKIQKRWEALGWHLELATCAESVSLEQYGIKHNKCIDDNLMRKLFFENKDLMHYLETGKSVNAALPNQISLFENSPSIIPINPVLLKDKGQREACGCIISKDIGMYNTCGHLCTYCYANNSRRSVIENMKKHSLGSESIID